MQEHKWLSRIKPGTSISKPLGWPFVIPKREVRLPGNQFAQPAGSYYLPENAHTRGTTPERGNLLYDHPGRNVSDINPIIALVRWDHKK